MVRKPTKPDQHDEMVELLKAVVPLLAGIALFLALVYGILR